MAQEKKLTPTEQFQKYNPYAIAAGDATAEAEERQLAATLAVAYETSRVRAEIRFSGANSKNSGGA